MEQSKAVAKAQPKSVQVPNSVDNMPTDLAAMREHAATLIKSEAIPFKTPEQAMIAMQAAYDLKISVVFALTNFHIVKGKLTAGVHVLSGLVLRGGVQFIVEEDFEPVVHYVGRGGMPVILSAKELLSQYDKYSIRTAAEITKDANGNIPNPFEEGKIQLIKVSPPYISEKPAQDRRTSIRVIRQMVDQAGNPFTMNELTQYYLHEAYQAGYMGCDATGKPLDGTKDNWYNHTRSMMYARCFGRMSKRYASDLTFGISEVSEVADTFDVPYEVVAGQPTIVAPSAE